MISLSKAEIEADRILANRRRRISSRRRCQFLAGISRMTGFERDWNRRNGLNARIGVSSQSNARRRHATVAGVAPQPVQYSKTNTV
jgi:hypothetical protein